MITVMDEVLIGAKRRLTDVCPQRACGTVRSGRCWRAASVAKYLLVLPIVLPPLVLTEVWAYLF